MKTLFILRHAKSSWAQPGLGDFDRPLNGRGREQCEVLSRWWSEREDCPQHVLCSPAARTRETLDRLTSPLGDVPAEHVDTLYAGSLDAYCNALYALDVERALIVGHNPTCDELVRYLATPDSVHATALAHGGYPTASIAELSFDCDWSELGQACAKLTQFVTVRALEDA